MGKKSRRPKGTTAGVEGSGLTFTSDIIPENVMRSLGSVLAGNQSRQPDGSTTGFTGSETIPTDVMQSLASRQWKTWFDDTVPMLDDMTPREAAKTERGREMIDDLLNLYDSMRTGMSIDTNIPSDYARWKLGYGPGSAEQFAEQEAIMNCMGDERPTQRKERHTKRLEKKKETIFIPQRCEVPGCTKKGDDVRPCSRCGCAYYCGKEHQVDDWPRHKLECKFLSTLENIRPRPFVSSDELENYPLGCFPVPRPNTTDDVKCFICHSKQSEVDIAYTRCCNLPVCDNSHEYRINSYSRDFCMRSHLMYTNCDSHFEEGHRGDWRECIKCNQLQDGARPFASTNGFCATPCMEKFLPQGSMVTYGCGVPFCKSRILPGHSNGTGFKNGITMCRKCSGNDGFKGHSFHL